MEKKKGFFKRLMDKLDKKMEQKAKEKPSCCCCEESGHKKKNGCK